MRTIIVPPSFFELPVDTVHVLCLNLAEQYAALVSGLDVLDLSEQDRAARYIDPWHGQRYACARSLLRHLLGRFLNQAPADICFSYGPYGKPSLKAMGKIDFSVTHCGDWLALAFSRGKRVGIDLENLIDQRDCLGVARQSFSPHELAELKEADNLAPAFCAIWVRKEAVLKAAGRGLDAMQAFSTSGSVVSLSDDRAIPAQWYVGSLQAPANHQLALAVEGGPARNRCFRLG